MESNNKGDHDEDGDLVDVIVDTGVEVETSLVKTPSWSPKLRRRTPKMMSSLSLSLSMSPSKSSSFSDGGEKSFFCDAFPTNHTASSASGTTSGDDTKTEVSTTRTQSSSSKTIERSNSRVGSTIQTPSSYYVETTDDKSSTSNEKEDEPNSFPPFKDALTTPLSSLPGSHSDDDFVVDTNPNNSTTRSNQFAFPSPTETGASNDSSPGIMLGTSNDFTNVHITHHPPVVSFQDSAKSEKEPSLPSKLHELCEQAQAIATLKNAKTILSAQANEPIKLILRSAGKRDKQGRTPLHLLSENKHLSEDLVRSDEVDVDDDDSVFSDIDGPVSSSFDSSNPSRETMLLNFVVGVLLPACPAAGMFHDDDGKIPFESGLTEWIEDLYGDMNMRKSRGDNAPQAKEVVMASLKSAVIKARASLYLAEGAKSPQAHLMRRSFSQSDVEKGIEKSPIGPSDADVIPSSPRTSRLKPGKTNRRMQKQRHFPRHVTLTNHASFTFKVLSAIIEKLEQLQSHRSRPSKRRLSVTQQDFGQIESADTFDKALEETVTEVAAYEEIKKSIIFNIAGIPDLMKMVLLIDTQEERNAVFSTTIMRRVMMAPQSVGGWLTAMLHSNQSRVQERAVEYLQRVSDLTVVQNPLLKNSKPTNKDLAKAERCYDALHNEISHLPDFVPSILSLGVGGIEEAATTGVVRRVMDRIISRPFSVVVIFCDMVFLTVLIVGFREAVNSLLLGGKPRSVMNGVYVANSGIFYFIIRELGKAISLCVITKRKRLYLCSFWNITDMLATLFAACSVVAIRVVLRQNASADFIDISTIHGLRDFLAVTTGLLWLRVLSILKGINMQLATFILAILQITQDTLSFGVILVTVIFTFAQMFFTVLLPDSCTAGNEGTDVTDLTCQQSEYYLRVYTILLGEFGSFERESFKTTFSLFLLVLYTFMVIIVLLNVLIAIASDSYEKCLIRSQNLFGRARVMLIAELVCFQNLLKRSDTGSMMGSSSSLSNSNTSSNSSSTPHLRLSQKSRWNDNKSRFKGWGQGSVLFFSLSTLVLVVWAVAELVGFFSGEHYGNLVLSMMSILVNIILFTGITLFLKRGAAGGSPFVSTRGNLVERDNNFGAEGTSYYELPNCLQRLMLRFMGSSQQTWNVIGSSDGVATEWRGRVHYIESKLLQFEKAAGDIATEQSDALEQLLASTESKLHGDMAHLDKQMKEIKYDIFVELAKSQEMTRSLILQLQKN